MSIYKLILFVLIFLFIGFIFYKIKPREFTDNTKVILNILFSELGGIYKKLDDGEISKLERQSLIIRKNEIFYILEKFFGKNLEQNNDELV